MNFKELIFLIAFICMLNYIDCNIKKCTYKSTVNSSIFIVEEPFDPIDLKDNELISKVCPNLYKKDKNLVCCDNERILDLNSRLENAYEKLNATDPMRKCFSNSIQLACHIYCNPNMNEYFEILNKEKIENSDNFRVQKLKMTVLEKDSIYITRSCMKEEFDKIAQFKGSSYYFLAGVVKQFRFQTQFNNEDDKPKALYFDFK